MDLSFSTSSSPVLQRDVEFCFVDFEYRLELPRGDDASEQVVCAMSVGSRYLPNYQISMPAFPEHPIQYLLRDEVALPRACTTVVNLVAVACV